MKKGSIVYVKRMEILYMKKNKRGLVLTFIWLILIYFMTEMPYFNGESTSTAIEKTIDKTETIKKLIVKTDDVEPIVFQSPNPNTIHHLNVLFRKSAHIIVFGILSIFIFKSLKRSTYSYLLALLFTFLLAIFDEWHQSIVPNRTSAFKDVLFDTLGAAVALFFHYIISRNKNRDVKNSVLKR
jgi:VanZ family protein